MQAIKCEICGGSDIIKTDGVYVCQHCGTKYTVDEARKLMGIVEIDKSKDLSNWKILAKRAREENNTENAAKYYALIAEQEPNDWEASFFSTYYPCYSARLGQMATVSNRVSNCLDNVFQMILSGDYTTSQQKEAYGLIMIHVISLFHDVMLNSINHTIVSYSTSSDALSADEWMTAACDMMLHMGDLIATRFEDYDLADTVYRRLREDIKPVSYRKAIARFDPICQERLTSLHAMRQKKKEKDKQQKRDLYWKEHDAEYATLKKELDDLQRQNRQNEKQILDLRRQRDEVPACEELGNLRREIYKMKKQKDSMGLFKGKEKRELQERIDLKQEQATALESLKSLQQSEYDSRIKALESSQQAADVRIGEIEKELAKDR